MNSMLKLIQAPSIIFHNNIKAKKMIGLKLLIIQIGRVTQHIKLIKNY
jgi:hypothetical protein